MSVQGMSELRRRVTGRVGSVRTLAEAFDAAKARNTTPAGTATAGIACGETTSVPGEGVPVILDVEMPAMFQVSQVKG